MREAALNLPITGIGESLIACNPLYPRNNAIALHFKGDKKKLMDDYFYKIFPSAAKMPSSYRSNPEKAGFEIPNIVNPFFKDYLAGAKRGKIINPASLNLGDRADILCKLMYLLSNHIDLLPNWVEKRAYTKSISSLNGGKGFDSPEKESLQDYFRTFDAMWGEISKNQYLDESLSVVPVSCDYIPIDGAHRVSICLAAEVDLPVLRLPVKRVPLIPMSCLRDRFGLSLYKNTLQLGLILDMVNSSIFIYFLLVIRLVTTHAFLF